MHPISCVRYPTSEVKKLEINSCTELTQVERVRLRYVDAVYIRPNFTLWAHCQYFLHDANRGLPIWAWKIMVKDEKLRPEKNYEKLQIFVANYFQTSI